MNVFEVMTRAPACAGPDTPLEEVARLMVDHNCGCIPVLDEDSAPIGVITDRDIVCRTIAHGMDPLGMVVRDAMTADCVTVREDTSIEDCCDVLETNQIRRAVVVDDRNHVVGIVAQADLARRDEGLAGELVAAISEPSIGPSAVH